MANAWLRLWHDMPNDPKWRTIARVSGQPIATVMAVYVHLLVSASQNVTTCHGVSRRGHVDVTAEDLASALDVTEEVIDSILQAMQGRVLDGDLITGWEKRQVSKEDNGNISQTAKTPAERKRAQREREKQREKNGDCFVEISRDVTACHDESRICHDESRHVTTDKDTDKDTDQEDQNTMVHGVKNATNQAGDVQTVNPGQPAGTTPEADSAYALKADSGAVQQVMTARQEQSHQLQQPEADSAIQREADRVVPENTGQPVGRVDYPDVFEQVWLEYPLRAGANPKKSAFSAWKARLREGVPPEAMLDGVRRYARYLAATGKTGTEFVQRATTFFGPDRNFENPWLLPVSGTNNQRCVNHISEPDTEIPPGFRG
ncbi:phage replisome organizer [Escherichia coli]|nr:phage replisome organizer [Escherichia coli]